MIIEEVLTRFGLHVGHHNGIRPLKPAAFTQVSTPLLSVLRRPMSLMTFTSHFNFDGKSHSKEKYNWKFHNVVYIMRVVVLKKCSVICCPWTEIQQNDKYLHQNLGRYFHWIFIVGQKSLVVQDPGHNSVRPRAPVSRSGPGLRRAAAVTRNGVPSLARSGCLTVHLTTTIDWQSSHIWLHKTQHNIMDASPHDLPHHRGTMTQTVYDPTSQMYMSILHDKILNQSGQNFAHVMTAVLSWHVQNYDPIGL